MVTSPAGRVLLVISHLYEGIELALLGMCQDAGHICLS